MEGVMTIAGEQEERRLQVGERGPDGRIYLGYAIIGRKIIHSSISSMKRFDPLYEGCPRRWFYEFREGKKEKKTDAQTGGSKFGKQLENYLKTGIDNMQPVLLPVKHFFPKPGPDLEVEVDLGTDVGRAIALRTMVANGAAPDVAAAEAEIKRCAGLTLAGVPLTGAPDCRHRRGEYIDEAGQLRKEDPGMKVVSIDDLKTTKRINDHVTRGGKLLPGWALTSEEVVVDRQMVAYGVHAADLYPDTTHVRLAHNYAQTENGFVGARRMGLVTVEHVRKLWRERDEPVMREMIDVAAADEAKHVPINTKACKAYNRDCPHLAYCQPERTLNDVYDFGAGAGEDTGGTMSTGNGLFDSIASGHNGTAPQPAFSAPATESLGLFGSQSSGPTPPPIPVNVMPDAERQRQIDEAKAKLRRHPLEGLDGYVVGQQCNGLGYYASKNGQGFVPIEVGHTCAACAKAPSVPHVGQVNPLDSPPFDPVAAQKALSPEEIAKITDPELKARAEAVARAAAERAALEATVSGAVAEKASSSWCSASNTTVVLTDKEKVTRSKKCGGCDKVHKIKDKDFTPDLSSMVVPKHRPKGADLPPPVVKPTVQVQPQPPAIPPTVSQTPPPIPATPALPVGEMTAMVEGMFGKQSAPELPQPPTIPVGGAGLPKSELDGQAFLMVPMEPPKPAPFNAVALIRHHVQSVKLGLDTKESAFDKIAAVLA